MTLEKLIRERHRMKIILNVLAALFFLGFIMSFIGGDKVTSSTRPEKDPCLFVQYNSDSKYSCNEQLISFKADLREECFRTVYQRLSDDQKNRTQRVNSEVTYNGDNNHSVQVSYGTFTLGRNRTTQYYNAVCNLSSHGTVIDVTTFPTKDGYLYQN